MTITFKGGTVFARKEIKGKGEVELLPHRPYKGEIKVTLEPNGDPLKDEVSLTKPLRMTFVGPQIKTSRECKSIGIGWFNPNDEPQRQPMGFRR